MQIISLFSEKKWRCYWVGYAEVVCAERKDTRIIFGTINKHERALDTRGESHEMHPNAGVIGNPASTKQMAGIGTRETGNNTLRAQTAADKMPIYKKEGKWEILINSTFFELAVSGNSLGRLRVVSR